MHWFSCRPLERVSNEKFHNMVSCFTDRMSGCTGDLTSGSDERKINSKLPPQFSMPCGACPPTCLCGGHDVAVMSKRDLGAMTAERIKLWERLLPHHEASLHQCREAQMSRLDKCTRISLRYFDFLMVSKQVERDYMAQEVILNEDDLGRRDWQAEGKRTSAYYRKELKLMEKRYTDEVFKLGHLLQAVQNGRRLDDAEQEMLARFLAELGGEHEEQAPVHQQRVQVEHEEELQQQPEKRALLQASHTSPDDSEPHPKRHRVRFAADLKSLDEHGEQKDSQMISGDDAMAGSSNHLHPVKDESLPPSAGPETIGQSQMPAILGEASTSDIDEASIVERGQNVSGVVVCPLSPSQIHRRDSALKRPECNGATPECSNNCYTSCYTRTADEGMRPTIQPGTPERSPIPPAERYDGGTSKSGQWTSSRPASGSSSSDIARGGSPHKHPWGSLGQAGGGLSQGGVVSVLEMEQLVEEFVMLMTTEKENEEIMKLEIGGRLQEDEQSERTSVGTEGGLSQGQPRQKLDGRVMTTLEQMRMELAWLTNQGKEKEVVPPCEETFRDGRRFDMLQFHESVLATELQSAIRLARQEEITDDRRISMRQLILKINEKIYEGKRKLDAERHALYKKQQLYWSLINSRFNNFPLLQKGYRLLNMIGKGGFAEVWESFDPMELKLYAAKVHILAPTMGVKQRLAIVEQVQQEIKIHQSVNYYKYIVNMKACFEMSDDLLVTILELCETDLDQHLKTNGPVSESLALRWTKQILMALKYMASLPEWTVHHCDLKPGNVLLHQGSVKLADFGLSKAVLAGDPPPQFGGAGTIWYLPPECLDPAQRSDVVVSDRIDVWAVGCILFEMMFGRRPFAVDVGDPIAGRRAPSTVVLENLLRGVRFKSEEVKTTSESCLDLITMLLNADPNERPSIEVALSHPSVSQIIVGE
eukprot:GHVQ01015142.1.p1 GENE.GHVQ01015142.1~~GHVQ01015142.1.p1  ORF type:complete len:1071 (-),score=151.56 GHVQ01015142.1:1359-4154(-)